MKRRVLVLAILVFGLGLSPGHTHAEVIACLGDSNTFGEGLLDRTHESYPAQLEMLLQQQNMNWEVRNFGVSGATVLRQGDIPYEYQDAFYEALASEPDYVIFCFGANGSRSENREYIRAHYVSDYLSLIDSFLALPHEPRILICYPLKAFSDIYSFSDVVIRDEIIPRIAEVASARNIPLLISMRHSRTRRTFVSPMASIRPQREPGLWRRWLPQRCSVRLHRLTITATAGSIWTTL